MNREASYLKMLEASANMQYNISIILESQADKAEKSRNWVCSHIHTGSFQDHEHQLKQSIEIHEQLIQLIAGLSKLENSLARNLKVVLGHDSEEEFGGGLGGLSGLLGQEDDM